MHCVGWGAIGASAPGAGAPIAPGLTCVTPTPAVRLPQGPVQRMGPASSVARQLFAHGARRCVTPPSALQGTRHLTSAPAIRARFFSNPSSNGLSSSPVPAWPGHHSHCQRIGPACSTVAASRPAARPSAAAAAFFHPAAAAARSDPPSGLLLWRGLARRSFPAAASGMQAHADRPGRSRGAAAAAAAGGGGGGGGAEAEARHTNRLAAEQSPYLLQHAHNPVDWYPWGEEAFARARAEDKPIFLSVGYATCHWCHVMEGESFESSEVADLLNRDFISVKVDREERPDVDRVYMTYVQAVSGSGGWPMSVWLTPQLEPFYGGTYYPPKDRFHGGQLVLPGFPTVLRRIASLWRTNRKDLKEKAASTLAQLSQALQPEQPPAAPPASPASAAAEGAAPAPAPGALTQQLAGAVVDAVALDLGRRYDGEWGGFGGPPKFPRPTEIAVLLRAAARTRESGDLLGASRLRDMALNSLRAMAGGGMYDQLGGGFHRYSVDELWHVPHFEKMLYDNPQLAAAYTAAFQLTGERTYAQVARGVLDYLLRDMAHPGGGFYSAEDADSAEAGGGKREGAFYVWSHAEVQAVLGPELAPLFCTVYGIVEEGNCNRSERSDPHDEFGGKNVPYIAVPPLEAAARLRLPYAADAAEVERRLAAAREALHRVRAARPRPALDDKIVTAWNGMAIGALALAGRALAADLQVERLFPVEGRPAPHYLAAAQRAAGFVRAQLWDPATGRLRRSFCRGAASGVAGFADDYASLVSGLLDLYECGGGREWLEWAVQLQATQDQLFWDAQSGGYYSTPDPASPDADPSIRIRIKDDYDGAEPTASSVSASNLLRLADLLPVRHPQTQPQQQQEQQQQQQQAQEQAAPLSYDEAAVRTLSAFSGRLTQAPLAVPALCCAAHTYSKRPLRQVIVAGRPGAPDTQALLDAVHLPYCPDKVVLVVDPTDPRDAAFYAAHNPAAAAMVEAHYARRPGGGGGERTAGGEQGPEPEGAVAATVFVCQNYTCLAPTADPARVREMLSRLQGPAARAPPSVHHFSMPSVEAGGAA